MSWNWELLGQTGLQFFGKMSASISHEIKNVMAIVNENAGLLEDFTVMAEKGLPIDPQRLKTRAGMIMKQIRRGDEIIKGMNRFAHSVDDPLRQVDLHETLSLMVALSSRFATMRGVTLELEPPLAPVPVFTNPFFLENVIWLCLDFAMGSTGTGRTVGLRAEKTDTGATIQFYKLQDLAQRDTGSFPGQQETALIEALKAGLVLYKESGEMRLALPAQAGK